MLKSREDIRERESKRTSQFLKFSVFLGAVFSSFFLFGFIIKTSVAANLPTSTTADISTLTADLRSLAIQLFVSSNADRPLMIGSKGTDVWALQIFLELDGAGPASVKLAATGPTGYFGALTQEALAEYQRSAGITPSVGYFGSQTRKIISLGTNSASTSLTYANPTPTTSTTLSENASTSLVVASTSATPIVNLPSASQGGVTVTFTPTAPPIDTTPPVISAITATPVETSTETIAWTTNEPANSQVAYGTSTSYAANTALNSSLVTSHSVTLTGLIASTTYDYQILTADGSGNLATSSNQTFTTDAFVYYVDSVNGNDSNNGETPAMAFKSLTSIPALTNGQSVGLADGSDWTDASLFIGIASDPVSNVTVAAYGSGAAPIIDSSKVISTSSIVAVAGQPGLYEATTTGPGSSWATPYGNFGITGPWINVWECKSAPCTPPATGGNDYNLLNQTSVASATSILGSYYVQGMTNSAAPSQGATFTLYFSASDGTNPATNGYTYTYSAAPIGLEIYGQNAHVMGIHTKKNADNDGSIVINGDGNSPTITNVIADQGGKHNMFVPGGAVVNSSTFNDEYYGTGQANPFVAFDGTGSGLSVTLENSQINDGQPSSTVGVATYSHTATGTFGALVYNNDVIRGVNGATPQGFGGTAGSSFTVSNSYCKNTSYGCIVNPEENYTITNTQAVGNGAFFYAGYGGITGSVTNSKACMANQQGAAFVDGNQASAQSLTVSSNTSYIQSPANYKNQIWLNGGTLTSNNNIFGSAVSNGIAYYLPSTTTYSGDHNQYPLTLVGYYNGSYDNLSTWQALVSPNDANSTSTGSAVSACTLPAGI
jgi:hypothetical protein